MVEMAVKKTGAVPNFLRCSIDLLLNRFSCRYYMVAYAKRANIKNILKLFRDIIVKFKF